MHFGSHVENLGGSNCIVKEEGERRRKRVVKGMNMEGRREEEEGEKSGRGEERRGGRERSGGRGKEGESRERIDERKLV